MATVELQIERLAKSGDGVAQHAGRTVFVEGALPGERVLAELHEGKVLRATVRDWRARSPSRREPPCALADRCGGCPWLHLDEAAQRAAKEEIVVSTLEHLGKLGRDRYQLLPTAISPRALGYRRRAALHPVGGGLGFHGRRSHEKVRVDGCPALDPALEALLPELAEALGGALRELTEVRLLSDGGLGVSLHVDGAVRPGLRARAEGLLKRVQSVVLVPGEGAPLVLGDPRIRADGFAQANAEVNAAMVRGVAEALDAKGHRVLELYAGNGNLTRGLEGATVTAVESAAVSMSLPGVRFIRGDAAKVARALVNEGARFERLLADPPRAGASGIAEWATGLGVSRVVYVACDPASLARDAAALAARGFAPRSLQLFDMFPQTHHVEAVMAFSRG